jgi:hydrogenase nickel incorporation protein HypA/HybF
MAQLIGSLVRCNLRGKMHELSIAQNIVDILNDQMKIHKLSRIESVSLRVGVLRSVEIESLSFSFNALTAGSRLEGARLEVEEVPVRGRCMECGQQFNVKNWLDDCPLCGGPWMEVTSGKELDIVAIEGD